MDSRARRQGLRLCLTWHEAPCCCEASLILTMTCSHSERQSNRLTVHLHFFPITTWLRYRELQQHLHADVSDHACSFVNSCANMAFMSWVNDLKVKIPFLSVTKPQENSWWPNVKPFDLQPFICMALCLRQTQYNVEEPLVMQRRDLKHFIQYIIFPTWLQRHLVSGK